jgi:hypothetical protein
MRRVFVWIFLGVEFSLWIFLDSKTRFHRVNGYFVMRSLRWVPYNLISNLTNPDHAF